MAPEEEPNQQTPHPCCISCAYICTENALTGNKIRHLWHHSALVELLATRTRSIKNTTITCSQSPKLPLV